MSEEVHKNIQVLKGIPENQFMATMGFFSASLGAGCDYCHVSESNGNWDKYADDNDHKRTARRMILMVSAINRTYFGGRRVVTCYSCHRGGERPKVTPNLSEVYGTPPPDEPDEIVPALKGPSAEQVLDRFIQALGGAERLATLKSFVGKGTYRRNLEVEQVPVEVFARAPAQRTTIIHAGSGDTTTTYDGRAGWIAAPEIDTPVPVLALSGGDLEAARLDAELAFPSGIVRMLTDWRIGFPTTVDDREVLVVQGRTTGRSPVKLYFDKESALLVRMVRYADSPVGLSPTQIDYADYREVSGVKFAFRWSVSWLDGRSTVELSDVQPNVPIDGSRFARPMRPAPGRPGKPD